MTNYFELLNIEQTYNIDFAQLKSNYQQLQKITHPDRYASASDAQKRLYMQKNAQINDAFQVLTSPVLRTQHILDVRNVPLPDANATMGDTEFLMQQMELREALSEAKNTEEIQGLKQQILQQQHKIEEAIDSNLSQISDQGNQNTIGLLTKLKFFTKLVVELDEKLIQIS